MTQIYEKGELYQISIIDLKTDPKQPRKSIDSPALEELAASIRTHGIIQPLLFRVADDSPYLYIVAGERRYKAAKIAGLLVLPCLCMRGNAPASPEGGSVTPGLATDSATTDINPAEIALIENMLRQDLTPVEEAEGLQSLMTEQKYTQEQLGGIIGKAQNTLSEILSINKLPLEIRDDCRGDRTIARSALITIAKKKQDRSMTTAYNAYKAKLQKGITTRQKKDPNEPQAVFAMMDKATSKIQSIDTSAWTEDDNANFLTSLTGLKTEIDNYLGALPPDASQEAPQSSNLA